MKPRRVLFLMSQFGSCFLSSVVSVNKIGNALSGKAIIKSADSIGSSPLISFGLLLQENSTKTKKVEIKPRILRFVAR